MKLLRFSAACALLLVATGLTAGEQDAVSLFNGKDLAGWKQINGTATYVVEDGVIVGTTVEGSPNSFLCTTKDYGDFELEFEVKVDDRLNSGVQIRSHSKADFKDGRVHGPQVEIEAAPGEAGYVYSEGTGRGWLSQDRTKNNVFKTGEWNHYRVRAVGPRIQTWINGEPVADLTDEESYRSGFIGLQVHSFKGDSPAQVRWRNIRIREVKEEQ
ncbi:MAG: 3-keto-disaccharide hydrolase [Planctomycetaceae bacterium]